MQEMERLRKELIQMQDKMNMVINQVQGEMKNLQNLPKRLRWKRRDLKLSIHKEKSPTSSTNEEKNWMKEISNEITNQISNIDNKDGDGSKYLTIFATELLSNGQRLLNKNID